MGFVSLHYQSDNINARIKALDIAKSFASSAILDMPLDNRIAFTPKDDPASSIAPLVASANANGHAIRLEI